MNEILFQPRVDVSMIEKYYVPVLAYYTPEGYYHAEKCGRLCYNSLDKMTNTSYEGFIKGIVLSGHESVIEHFHVVYLIFKQAGNNKEIYRELFEMQNFTPAHINVTETKHFFIVSGNIRMFKDVVRGWRAANSLIKNKVIEGFRDSFSEFEPCLFADFIKEGYLKEEDFKTPEQSEEDYDKIGDAGFQYHRNFENDIDVYLTNFKIRLCDGEKTLIDVHPKILRTHNMITSTVNMPRETSHQHVRHRIAGYSQQSQRYIDFSNFKYEPMEGVNMDEPIRIKDNLSLSPSELIDNIRHMYQALINNGHKREVARGVLPQITMSRIATSRTVHDEFIFLGTRLDSHAQYFIREKVARPVYDVLLKFEV